MNSSVSQLIKALNLDIANYLPSEPSYGYTFKFSSKTVQIGSLDEKLHFLLHAKTKSCFLDWNIVASQKLSLFMQKQELRSAISEIWKGPPAPLHPGIAIVPMKVINVDYQKQEVVLREQTRIIDLWYSVKRDQDTLFSLMAAIPTGRWGHLFWKTSIEPIYPIFAKKLLENVALSVPKTQDSELSTEKIKTRILLKNLKRI